MNSIAVMQPYFFPYIGYFQLINAVDIFVLYDDVNYIKGGWINRNRILLNGEAHLISIPCNKISPHKHIRDITYNYKHPFVGKIIKSMDHAYRKAPYYDEVFPMVKNILLQDHKNISSLAEESIKSISRFLELNVKFEKSSEKHSNSQELERSERLIQICTNTGMTNYINSMGGLELYSKAYFSENNINLSFLKSKSVEYKQFKNKFIPNLSIIDVLMFNSKEEIAVFLSQYELI